MSVYRNGFLFTNVLSGRRNSAFDYRKYIYVDTVKTTRALMLETFINIFPVGVYLYITLTTVTVTKQ